MAHHMKPGIDLLTEGLRLREYESPAEAVQAWAMLDASRTAGLAAPPTKAPTQATAFWDRIGRDRSQTPRTRFELAVTLRGGGSLIGGVRIEIIDAGRTQGDIGYGLHPSFWSQGYGTEAASEIIRFGFAHLGLKQIWATCDPSNAASIRVLEKTGMQDEGVLPRRGPPGGSPLSSHLYGITADGFRRFSPHPPLWSSRFSLK